MSRMDDPSGSQAAAVTIRHYTCAEYLRRQGYQIAPLRRIRIAEIQMATAMRFNIPLREMTSARRYREVARPRQVAMYLARELTPHSLPQIGRLFGDRDHTTVIHALRRIEELIETDGELAANVEWLRGELAA